MEFNFDESSAAWLANKIRKGYSYVYKCDKCIKPAVNVRGNSVDFLCATHRREKVKLDMVQASKNGPHTVENRSTLK